MMTQKYSLFDVCVCVYVGRWNALWWSSFFLDATASFWWQGKVRATQTHTHLIICSFEWILSKSICSFQSCAKPIYEVMIWLSVVGLSVSSSAATDPYSFLINNWEHSSALLLMPLICELLLRFDEFELLELSDLELLLLLLLLLELELLSLSLSSLLDALLWFAVAFEATFLLLYMCDDLWWCDPLWLWCRLSLLRISAIWRRSSVR